MPARPNTPFCWIWLEIGQIVVVAVDDAPPASQSPPGMPERIRTAGTADRGAAI